MNYRQPARTRPAVLAALVVGAALLLGVLAYRPLASLGTSAVSSVGVPPGLHHDPPGVSVFADDIPSVANLDPELLRALRRAATDAADDGVEFVVNSGWRSREYQAQLLREAVAEYGSETEAARWVATPDTSAHVSGDAVDLGPDAATAWLSRHGAAYGLCQIYANEPWHYELRTDATDYGCPTPYIDPTEDPRMHQ